MLPAFAILVQFGKSFFTHIITNTCVITKYMSGCTHIITTVTHVMTKYMLDFELNGT
jgi:hypothetical protein